MNKQEQLKQRLQNKKISQPNADEELEEIINESIQEIKQVEEIAKVIKQVEKEDKKVPLKTEDEIFREIIKFRSVEHNHFIEIIKELHYLKKHYMKVTTTLLLVACFGSYIAGTQHQTIAPYVGKAWDIMSSLKPKGE